MKNQLTALLVVLSVYGYSQIPAYYNDVNLNLSGQQLFQELQDKVTGTHTTFLSYTPGVWDALKQVDRNGSNSNDVVLLYGYNDSDGDSTTDRTRGVNENGGGATDWNREHVYPKSLGTPNLGEVGPGADAHHLRPTDVQRNSNRGSRKFAEGSGTSGTTAQGYWYPGDEFKGDVARMMMYMYVRYGNRCLPTNVGIGSSVSSDSNMISLFLEWNAEDPVSSLETRRNSLLIDIQGNRNPFIDNPAFATQIWGGVQAQDIFGGQGDDPGTGNTACTSVISSFPYTESFEGGFGSWKQATTDDFDWELNSGATASSGTGPSIASSGATYMYMESSKPNYASKSAILYSPCYDLSRADQAVFSFDYTMYGSLAMGGLRVEASQNGTAWTSVWNISGNQGSAWQTARVDLAAYAGSTVQLRFNGVTGTTWQGDMAVDNLRFSTAGTGGGGSTTSATIALNITFDNYPEETSWTLSDASNTVISSGGPYDSQEAGSTIRLTGALDAGCYTLIFKDAFGDGMCCSYGNGSYQLTNTDSGAVLISGGAYGGEAIDDFCIGTGSKKDEKDLIEDTASSFDLYPSPASDHITIQTTSGLGMPYMIINQVGQIVQKGVVNNEAVALEGLPTGVYFIKVLFKEEGAAVKRFSKY